MSLRLFQFYQLYKCQHITFLNFYFLYCIFIRNNITRSLNILRLNKIDVSYCSLFNTSALHSILHKRRVILFLLKYFPQRIFLNLLHLLTKSEYTVKDPFHFAEEIFKQDRALPMGSLDIELLFTNILPDETIDISVHGYLETLILLKILQSQN